MNARILAATSFLTALAGSLPAADPQLLKLVMPDAKAISDINVAQAKLTPFGQFALGQLTNPDIQKLITLTGFDPSKDLNEVLCATNGDPNTGVALATGIFDPVKIGALAAQDGAVTETYQGATILEDPKKGNAVAFLNSGLMAAGNLADVKAAIGRQSIAHYVACIADGRDHDAHQYGGRMGAYDRVAGLSASRRSGE